MVSVSIVISAVGVNKKRFSNSARADSSSVTWDGVIGSLIKSGIDLPEGL